MTREEANKLLTDRLAKVKNEIKDCEKFADEHGLYFHSPIDVYAMGGTYVGKNAGDDRGESNKGRWISSSEGCW